MTATRRPAAAPCPPAWWSPWSARGATLAYTALAIVFTWPLVTVITRSLPWDLGDPALNAWILAWSADHLFRFLGGHLDALTGYWNANIFYPEPLALAYSEHLFGQALQVWPVWALTRNPILCYNLVLLSTYVLSGLGTFLLVRDLTGQPRAAFVAGVAFGFAPYRIAQLSHLQVLSAQWLPFAMYAIRRHVATGSLGSLAGFVLAALLQNLSCGYYILFFGPFLAVYAALEIGARWFQDPAGERAGRRVADWHALLRLGGAFLLIAAGTWPFLSPYLELRRLGFPPRQLAEVISFSANVWGYATASPEQWLWGDRVDAFAKAEGELFPGFTAPALAVCGIAGLAAGAWRGTPEDRGPRWAHGVSALALLVIAVSLAAGIVTLVSGESALVVGGLVLRARIERTFSFAVLAAVVLLAVSRRARTVAGRLARSPASWFAVAVMVAVVLSFGPEIQVGRRTLVEEAPYRWMYAHVPGFDGLRVPARYAMLVEFGLAVLAGYGVAWLSPRTPRHASLTAACVVALVLEGGAAPLPLDRSFAASGFATPPSALPGPAAPPRIYAFVAQLPADAAIVELPFGVEAWDIRYVFGSTFHWHRLVNGYSGGFPTSYYRNIAALRDVFRDPAIAWDRLVHTGASYVVVHESAYLGQRGQEVTAWLLRQGARPVVRFRGDVVLRMPAAGLE